MYRDTIYDRPVIPVDEKCWFIRTTEENPYILYRFTGTVRDVSFVGDIWVYLIEIDRCLETFEFLKKHIENQSFITYVSDTKQRVYRINPANKSEAALAERLKGIVVEVPCTMVYDSLEEQEEFFKYANRKFFDMMNQNIKILQSR